MDIGELLDSETQGMAVRSWAQERDLSFGVSQTLVQKGFFIDWKSERTYSGEAAIVLSYQLGKCSDL